MGDTNSTAKKKKPFFKGVRSELKKITWPSKEDIFKQTVITTILTVIIAAIIAGVDFGFRTGVLQNLLKITLN